MTSRGPVRFLLILLTIVISNCAPPGTTEVTVVDVRRAQELKGDSCMALGQYWNALPYYQNAWALSDSDVDRAQIEVKLYEVYYLARDWDSCVVQAEALRDSPWFDALSYKGLVYWRAGEFEEVLGFADASALLRAEAASRLGLQDSADALYAEAERLLGEVARGRRAEVYADIGQTDRAIGMLESLRYPTRLQRRLLVELLFDAEEWGQLPSAIEALPNRSERLAARIRFYDATGDEQARRTAQIELITNYPGNRAAQQAAKEIAPRNAEETYAVAMAYKYIDREKALELFQDAERMGHAASSCRWQRANLLYRIGHYDEAYDLLKDMSSDDALFLLAKVEVKRGRNEAALQALRRVAENSSVWKNKQEAWERQATILQQEGSNLEAAELSALGARTLDDEELGHRSLILWLTEADTANATSALTGYVPLDPDIKLFYSLWLTPSTMDSVLMKLDTRNPFSYYAIAAHGDLLPQPGLYEWFTEIGDTNRRLPEADSVLAFQAFALAEAGFFDEASRKLGEIDAPSLPVLYTWARRFQDMGADNLGIFWVERLLTQARKRGVKTRPLEVLRLQFPTGYMLHIQDNIDDPALFLALTHQESWFNPRAKSPANAYGLCQLLYSTARGMDSTVTVDSLYEAHVSIRLGAEFLRRMRERFDGRKVAYLAAYNAGPGASQRWIGYLPGDDALFAELIPYDETRHYVKRLLRNEIIYRSLLGLTETQ